MEQENISEKKVKWKELKIIIKPTDSGHSANHSRLVRI